MLGKAWNSWYSWHMTTRRRKILAAKVIGRLKNLKIAQGWNAWYEAILIKRQKEASMNKALTFFKNLAQGKAWNSFVAYVERRKKVKRIAMRWMNPFKAKALAGELRSNDVGWVVLLTALAMSLAWVGTLHTCSSHCLHRKSDELQPISARIFL